MSRVAHKKKKLTVECIGVLNSTYMMWEDKDLRGKKKPSEQLCGAGELKANISSTTEVKL